MNAFNNYFKFLPINSSKFEFQSNILIKGKKNSSNFVPSPFTQLEQNCVPFQILFTISMLDNKRNTDRQLSYGSYFGGYPLSLSLSLNRDGYARRLQGARIQRDRGCGCCREWIVGDLTGVQRSRRFLSVPGEQRHRTRPQQAHSANSSR